MTDRELSQQVEQGSQSAFAEIVHRHSAMVFSRAMAIMHSEEGAAEVTQLTFVRAYEAISDWRGNDLKPWLSAIAVHTALKLLDKERRRRTSPIDRLPAEVAAEPSTAAEHEARLQQMEAAISTLTEEDQRLLRLHYYDRLTTADTARRTGLTQSNVLVRLHRIRERLKTMMTHERND